MPVYEYACASCQARFEKYVRAWGEAVACPECQGQDVEKLLSTFALSSGGGSSPAPPMGGGGGGGCCRGGCGCGH